MVASSVAVVFPPPTVEAWVWSDVCVGAGISSLRVGSDVSALGPSVRTKPGPLPASTLSEEGEGLPELLSDAFAVLGLGDCERSLSVCDVPF